jgi:hypothetical protein
MGQSASPDGLTPGVRRLTLGKGANERRIRLHGALTKDTRNNNDAENKRSRK